jgi:hypothetical protein
VTPSVTPTNTVTPTVTPTNTPTNTPPSGDNFFVTNNTLTGSLDNVGPAFYIIITGTFPLSFGQGAQGIHGGITSSISVDVSTSSQVNVNLIVNGSLQQCLSTSSPSILTFTAITILSTDVVNIIMYDGACL